MKKTVIGIVSAVIVVVLVCTVTCIIPAGHTGVIIKLGAVQDEVLQEGFHVKTPFITKIKKIDNRVIRVDVDGSSSSKDLQTIGATVSVNYRVNTSQSSTLYKNVGNKYEDVVVRPAIQESLKAVAAQYTAEELITRRQDVSEQMKENLSEKISSYGLTVEKFNILNFNFSEEFDRAIEAKQTAQQEALKAEQDLQRIKVEAEQEITKAQAEAEAYKLKSTELTDNMVKMEAINKWDGKLPTYMTSGQEMFNIPTN